ncbi:hypothetical protein AVEN_87861-1 [Araneus ventricosus]|uniref:Uncharacterized protein n=1 Tax=Araneus ventricosus TaxID=182803 RepID=A0A4Y2BCP3_ARAVE|nr:hypothetical protein AVEN_87861-1 [Araneus ventricosus]
MFNQTFNGDVRDDDDAHGGGDGHGGHDGDDRGGHDGDVLLLPSVYDGDDARDDGDHDGDDGRDDDDHGDHGDDDVLLLMHRQVSRRHNHK